MKRLTLYGLIALSTITACGGSGGGASPAPGSSSVGVVATGTTGTTPTPSSTASASSNPSASPSASASHSPSPAPSATATAAAFVDTACTQTLAPSTGALTSVASTFFSTIIPNAHTICLSAWDLSSDVASALETAARNGANVTVITPYSEYSDNSGYLNGNNGIIAAGGHSKIEYTSSPGTPSPTTEFQHAPMDIHAKFALIDGVAYMDGHNFFTTDVVLQDGIAGDAAAIQNDLVNFPASPPSGTTNASFTTDKQLSLENESNYLQQTALPALNGGTALEYDFITESFNPNPSSGDYNDDVYDGMCQIAALSTHVTMKVVVEDFSGDSSSAKSALQNLMLLDPNASVKTTNSGQEKISMIRATVNGTPLNAWFGSSNSTTTDLFDWGMDISDAGVLTALQTYYDTAFNGATAVPTASPATTPQPCNTPHP